MECRCKVVVSVVKGRVATLTAKNVQRLGVSPIGANAVPEDVMEGKTFYAGDTEKKVGTYDPNIEIMKGVDLTEINHDGGYDFGSERDYIEANAEFQYWANIIMYGEEEPYQKPDLPTLQSKIVKPKTSPMLVRADDGYELESVLIEAVTSEIDSDIRPENIRMGVNILGVQGNVAPDKPDQEKTIYPSKEEQVVVADTGYELAKVTIKAVDSSIDEDIKPENIRRGINILGVDGIADTKQSIKEENIMVMKIADGTIRGLFSAIGIASDEEYSQAEDRMQQKMTRILGGV